MTIHFLTKTTKKCAKFIDMNLFLIFLNLILLIFHIWTVQWLNCKNLKDELNSSYNGGEDTHLLQSVAINFKHTARIENHLDKYEINHTGNGKTDGQKRTEVRTGNIYESVQSNVVNCGVTERHTLITQVIINTFWHTLTRRISLVQTNVFILWHRDMPGTNLQKDTCDTGICLVR